MVFISPRPWQRLWLSKQPVLSLLALLFPSSLLYSLQHCLWIRTCRHLKLVIAGMQDFYRNVRYIQPLCQTSSHSAKLSVFRGLETLYVWCLWQLSCVGTLRPVSELASSPPLFSSLPMQIVCLKSSSEHKVSYLFSSIHSRNLASATPSTPLLAAAPSLCSLPSGNYSHR